MEDTLSSNGDLQQNVGDAESPSTKRRDRGSECSHKVIEKRRRDRINTSLGELSQMLPVQNNGKQGSGKLEKAEILEKTVEYLKTLKSHLTELQEKNIKVEDETRNPSQAAKQDEVAKSKPDHFGGYKDCTEEVFRFLVNVEAMDMQQPCFQRLMAHLRHQIQLLMESRSDLVSKGKNNGKTNGKMSNGNRTALKRKSNGTMSSSSSSASSSMEETSNGSGSSSGGKAKRARVHNDSSKEASSSSNGHSTCSSGSSDNENSSDNSREHLSDSAICLDDELVDMPRNTSKETSTRSGINRSSVNIGSTNRNENSTNSSSHGPSMLLQGPNLPLRGPFIPTPYALPTYALHPAGTHYIPIVLHPSIPPPPSVSHQMPCGMMPPANGTFGLPPQPQGMFGLPFPYMHPGLSPYGSYHASAMGFPFLNGMCKDFPGQGLADSGNVDSGSNGDECSVESRNSSENIACQTNTPSPSNSGNESSNTDDGGN